MMYSEIQRPGLRRTMDVLDKAAGYPRCTWLEAPDEIKNWDGEGTPPIGWTMHATHHLQHRSDPDKVMIVLTPELEEVLESAPRLTAEEHDEIKTLQVRPDRPLDLDNRDTYRDPEFRDEDEPERRMRQ